ncbi:alpha/beta hydrolase [Microbacterium sp. zg-Y818]|uniref:alpha/beta hydrolase n=1 Tax=unclassified Microbacterium TaxID=2609290 RepID=UPI00214B3C2B|nr:MULTISPECIES: alpha/beta hydrolase [unclassified Microbacterium]MCR2799865.1 alpha/beta hydrolase [Microbacterium sp. zg.Y818]WIM21847.1 alpha/beta hydrolase [Microbacterium sp. zg-Y818]
MAEQWTTDILGAPFESLTLPLGNDDEGPVVATLVRSLPSLTARMTQPLRDVDVLYVHGWSDYFFQTELARFWNHLGARFHALDLRKYGRSLREGQTPGYINSLDEYGADIGAALAVMGHAPNAASGRRLVLLGHSTGGLTLTLWAARHPGRASALVLNSPWLELQLGAIGRQAIAPLVQVRARVDPLGTHPAVDLGFYTRAQTELGSLPADPPRAQWRPDRGFATHPGWLAAILEGHRRVSAGLDVGCPALVMLAERSSNPMVWSQDMTSTDSVLVVDDIAKAATRIGKRVSVERINGGIHDLFLSSADPRAEAYAALQRWLTRGAVR